MVLKNTLNKSLSIYVKRLKITKIDDGIIKFRTICVLNDIEKEYINLQNQIIQFFFHFEDIERIFLVSAFAHHESYR